ncbi:GPI ethanolamine phosphate transferase 2, partial [Plakobranchus ocellatus]
PKHGGLVSQTDLCPTLAVILGVPIPSGNIGQVITEALTGYTLPQKVAILYHNAVQSMQVLGDCVSDLHKESAYLIFREAKLKLRKWLVAKNDSLSQRLWESQGEGLLTSFSESLRLISEQVSKLSTQYDVYAMAVSIVLMWMILVSLLLSSMPSYETAGTGPGPSKQYLYTIFPIVGSAVLSHIIMCTGEVKGGFEPS